MQRSEMLRPVSCIPSCFIRPVRLLAAQGSVRPPSPREGERQRLGRMAQTQGEGDERGTGTRGHRVTRSSHDESPPRNTAHSVVEPHCLTRQTIPPSRRRMRQTSHRHAHLALRYEHAPPPSEDFLPQCSKFEFFCPVLCAQSDPFSSSLRTTNIAGDPQDG